MTQHQQIAKYLDEFGSITPMQAFSDLGITKLATRIGEMIRGGQRISKELVTGRNRYGEKTVYMRYRKDEAGV